MRISHEAIYQALYIVGRGALRRELTTALRTGRSLRVPRARAKSGKSFLTKEVMIAARPAEVNDRAAPGHWESQCLCQAVLSIGTLVEGTTRFTILLQLPPMDEHKMVGAQIKNGPATAGHGADAVCDAIARTITALPEMMRKSLTWDQGAEMAQHARLRIQTGLPIYFADANSPWQRPTNENTNGLLDWSPKVGLGNRTLCGCGDLVTVFIGTEVSEPLLKPGGVPPAQVVVQARVKFVDGFGFLDTEPLADSTGRRNTSF